MSNRFEHLKDKKQGVDSFIEGANVARPEHVSRKRKDPEQILLSISSKMNREQECEKPILLHLKSDIAKDIDKYCHGNKQAILNYLVRAGLDALIADKELILL
mgnify:CR=1 FL=1